ncbi:MAG TPA: hypothetical protein VMQ62_05755 [Dongiaceae bacterium]|nr:hypothetical protein [Dongiaceae bacterium]
MQKQGRRRLGWAIAALGILAFGGGNGVRAQAIPAGDTLIEGTIRISGCTVPAANLLVRARPVRAPQAWSGETHLRRATAGEAPGEFGFLIDGLEPGVPYRVGVRLSGASARTCPQIAWSADRDPLVLTGGSPLVFHGYAVRSSIEVLATTEGRARGPEPVDVSGGVIVHAPKELWVGADALDFRNPSKAVRRFRWRSDLPGVTGGRLQISLKPFPKIGARSYDPCGGGSAAGVVRQVDFDAASGAWAALPDIDFHDLLTPDDPGVDGPAVADATLAKLDLGLPIHVRVIPKVGERLLCDPEEAGAPPEVLLANLLLSLTSQPPSPNPELSVGKIFYTTAFAGKQPFPGEVCYRVTRNHALNPNIFTGGWDLSASLYAHDSDINGGVIQEGASFCIPAPSDDDGWFDSVVDTFGSVLSGIVDGIGKLVNFTSNLWEEIQDQAVDAVAHAVDDLGIVDCGPGSKCRDALETGLEVALASMGVPPSIPNFEELTDMGADYIASQIASEAGIPEVVSDYASDKAQEFVKKAVADMKAANAVPGLPDWLVPDLHFRNAFLTIELFGRGTDLPYDSRPAVIRAHTAIFAGAYVPLPRRLPKPGETPVILPMVLPPNLDGLPESPSKYDEYQKARVNKNDWVKLRYKGGCYNLVLTGLSDPGGVAPLMNASFIADDQNIVPCTP